MSSGTSSSVPTESSISISRNSSESKTSPQSRHSTNSVSSCRETIRTLGCLQAVAIALGVGEVKYSFRQIVAVFTAIENGYLLKLPIQDLFFKRAAPISGRDLKSGHNWSYTECGPKKSDIHAQAY